MPTQAFFRLIGIFVTAIVLSSCGGGNSGTGGGGGGGGLSVAAVSPSTEMITDTTGNGTLAFNIIGQNFTPQSQVLIDGQAATSTSFVNANTLWVTENITYSTFLGTHQFTVQNGPSTSNSSSFTLYIPEQGPLVMQAIPGYVVGLESDPSFIAASDLNGDGYADVVTQGPVNNFQGSLAILYGQADGSLALPQYLPGIAPYSLAISDIDGNGTADLVAMMSDDSLNIFLGDGHGNFQPVSGAQSFNGNYPGRPQLADLDGDGKPDVVVSVQAPIGTYNIVIWFKNLGGGNFAAPVALTSNAAGDNTSIAIADVNGDGKPDIMYAIAGPGSEFIHTLVNQGNGQFTDTLTPGLNGVTGVFNTLDFNLDGKPDLVVQFPSPAGGIAIDAFAGNGSGSFTHAASTTVSPPLAYESFQFVVGDFDHDGFPDLAGVDGETEPSHILYLFGNGDGGFTPVNVVGPMGFQLAAADINGDGIPDVVTPDRFNVVSVALGRTDRNFPSLLALTPATSAPPSLGDINGDGKPDILVPGTVYLNEGNGNFQLAAYTSPGGYMLADLTGKGVVDLIGGDAVNLLIWPNNGTPNFTSSPITVPPPVEGYFTVADMDGDGHPDIVELGGILWGNSNYQFDAVALPDPFATYAVGDFNGDGRLDIASDTFVFLNQGNRNFRAIEAGTGAPNLSQGSIPVVADFNGDGYADIAVVSPQSAGAFIYYSRGDGTFYLGAILDTVDFVGGLPGASAIATGDFDGDGRPDIAVGLEDTQQVVIFFNQGNGQYKRAFFASGASTIGLASSALVHPGKTDLVIANFNVDFRTPNVNVMFHQ
jgi:hypothetical protein